ncbi:gamma-glutamylcyclotransferase [Paramagnetospirillum marisnigri]|uniref:glutathione-specific gamma-glutamylcyclotransferase n=1 Tax=Paramagnetospirillum marisnigri TaxID=1285242 RepID=A0A178MD49_9PROT|nr:gamma-glutamylcyclotransferase [Paramagnetospirillum marisnigri]OAN46689.1 gamma-glutamylcyclotransferase [Paramagnetospirillum marisnigri]
MTTERDLWVFGYGSLMWRPGFDYDEIRPALLEGWHRDFCVYSRHWRGTPQKPGLVLGLDVGGSCRGLAFRVEAARRAAVIDYLNERELIGYAYVARTLDVRLDDGRVEAAYTFVADTDHHHYAGHLPLEDAAAIIMDAEGCAGLNRDYLINTIRQLEKDGFSEPDLHALLVEVERQTGIIEAGSGI